MRAIKLSLLATTLLVACSTLAQAGDLSTSVMRPTPVDPATGVVAGNLPGGQGSRSYYVSVELAAGDFVTQLEVAGTPNTGKRLDLELLDGSARAVGSTYVMAGLDAKGEATKTFPIDHAGRYVIRLTADGKESGSYCVLMGGSALPSAKAPGCPAAAAPPPPIVATAPPPIVAVAPPPRPVPAPQPVAAPAAEPAPRPVPAVIETPKVVAKPVEVIVAKCEERLRVGSDFLFDFDRAELRPEAEPALAEVADRVAKANKAVMIEGHTDGKGTDSYNQSLSERRAMAVRIALAGRGLMTERLNLRGFGKSRPVAPNMHEDGTDDPEGRQRNRRVEIVINTCN
ncbi:MAG: OmpA family protein [Xanthobacteraceae bacterium]|nr:OmpA family protein [Xanthobacteraceae bacterium]